MKSLGSSKNIRGYDSDTWTIPGQNVMMLGNLEKVVRRLHSPLKHTVVQAKRGHAARPPAHVRDDAGRVQSIR